jgi:hypothetical protein
MSPLSSAPLRAKVQRSTVMAILFCLLFSAAFQFLHVSGACLEDATLNAEFEVINGGSIPTEGSCCMLDVCGLTCPEETSPPRKGMNYFGLTRFMTPL